MDKKSSYCLEYCGIHCVNGTCPSIENSNYQCKDCWLYDGCKDCYFNRNNFCDIYKKNVVLND